MLGILFTSKGNFKRIVRSPTMGDRSTDDSIYKVTVKIPLFLPTQQTS